MDYVEPLLYAVKHKVEDVRLSSRSGGIFTALTDIVLKNGGIVYGCVLNEKFEAVHVRADNFETRNKMRGSKYIQSKIGETFKQAKEDLENNKKVLFSGTSCQIAGLKSFLKKEYKNLICIDIACHGVPSPRVWNSYIKWLEEKNGKCIDVDFRNKKDFGWKDHVETLIFNKQGKKIKINNRIFVNMFYSHDILRPSCYYCPYKSVKHPGDITIADYWGIDEAVPEFNDNKGVSLVFINNDVGKELFDKVENDIIFKKTKIEKCMMRQAYIGPFPKPSTREKFWNDYRKYPFKKIAKRYDGNSIKSRIQKISRKVINKFKRIVS